MTKLTHTKPKITGAYSTYDGRPMFKSEYYTHDNSNDKFSNAEAAIQSAYECFVNMTYAVDSISIQRVITHTVRIDFDEQIISKMITGELSVDSPAKLARSFDDT